MDRFTGLLGLVVVMAVAYLFSSNRRAIQPRPGRASRVSAMRAPRSNAGSGWAVAPL